MQEPRNSRIQEPRNPPPVPLRTEKCAHEFALLKKTDTAWQMKRGKYENLSTVERKNLRAAELESRGLRVPKNPKDDKALPEQLHSRYKTICGRVWQCQPQQRILRKERTQTPRFLNSQVLRSADNTDESITILDKGYLHARRSGFLEVRLLCNREADTADLSPVLLASNGLAGHVDAGPLVYFLNGRREHTLIKVFIRRIQLMLAKQEF